MRIDPPHPAAENLMAMMCFNAGQLKHLEAICAFAEGGYASRGQWSNWVEACVHYRKQFAARREELEAQMKAPTP